MRHLDAKTLAKQLVLIARVAEGAADIYPRLAPTCEWDTAAAQAVLEGAGGVVVDLQGKELRYGKPDVLNPSFIATRDTALIPA
jgi:3'(2'), 5'-bisphosphate nucleotidase